MADSSTGPRKWPHYEMHLMTFATMDTNNACLLILCAFLILFAVLFVVFRAAEHYTCCWDGQNLYRADHMGHISYPESGTLRE
ncbi:hypothetical protein VUR80DRAFT_1249 [Thermomyces stellatus]